MFGIVSAELCLTHATLTLEELDILMKKRSGEEGYSVGDIGSISGRPRNESCWVQRLHLGAGHAGTEGLTQALVLLDEAMVLGLAEGVGLGGNAVLSIHQVIPVDGCQYPLGVHMSMEAIGKLAKARASLSIDQTA